MIVAPAKTPKPVIDLLHNELTSIMSTPEVKAQIAKLSLIELKTPSVSEMQSYVKSEIDRWGTIVKKAGIAGTQ
jgi:tripartite-type tricarboxylate transporter receptor subunit TctC